MGLTIATNEASMVTSRLLAQTAGEQAKSYQRLASGQRITQAGDDAAGLSISESLRAQVKCTTNQKEMQTTAFHLLK